MQTAQEIRDLADLRIEEATLLYENGFYDGAIYLAGYAVELILKAKICEVLDIPNFFHEDSDVNRQILKSFKTHDLQGLLALSGLRNRFRLAAGSNDDLFENWDTICEWSENYRYYPRNTHTEQDAFRLLNAITNSTNGFRTWIDNI